jgi:DNA repair protein RecO (recombination protein O)
MTRQRLYRTPAVVLKRMDLGEADRIVTFFSRDQGKLRAVAKGVRRVTSRSAGHLEPFTLTDVLFAVGRELDVVSQADTIEAFRQLREDLVLTTHAYYLAEVVDLLTEEHLENRAVYDVLLDSFRELSHASDSRLVLIAFHLRLLDALGYRPELRQCVACSTAIEPAANQFSALQGGALCPPCATHEPSARPISVPALKLLRYVQGAAGQQSVNAPGHVAREAEALLRDYAEQLGEKHRLRSPALMARVSEADAYTCSAP